MNIFIRTDGSTKIATGHVIRCLTLADALRSKGADCIFIHRLYPGHMADFIRHRGYTVIELEAPTREKPDGSISERQSEWHGISQEEDANDTINALRGLFLDVLIVDHYGLHSVWEALLKKITRNLLVIDDMVERKHECEILINQNYMPGAHKHYSEILSAHTRILLGPRYALIRPEFARARHYIKPPSNKILRILVFYGGVDLSNETSRAIRVLSHPNFSSIKVDVVVGVNNIHRDEITRQVKTLSNIIVHGPREHLADLMSDADLMIGAGGTTTWERCCLGLPGIITAVADNQTSFNEVMGKEGLSYYLGKAQDVTDEKLAVALEAFIDNPNLLEEQSLRLRRLTDGLGALRVADIIWPTDTGSLILRSAQVEDKELFFEWANEHEARRLAYNQQPIPWEVHNKWFEHKISDPEAWLKVLITPQGLPIGQVRVEIKDNVAIISYSIDRDFRGLGWGTRLLELTVEMWAKEGSSAILTGLVRTENYASRRAFLSAGFCESEDPVNRGKCFRLLTQNSTENNY